MYDDIIKGVHSALPRRHAGDESSNHESMGASSGCPEPAKGRSTGCHNGKTGTGNVYVQRTSPFDRIYPLPPTSMTKRKMRTSKSLLVACLPIFAGLASAQLVYPNCTAGWEWSSNSLGQNPCNVAAYLEATCGTGRTFSHHLSSFTSPFELNVIPFWVLSLTDPHRTRTQCSKSTRYRKVRCTVAQTLVRATCASAIPSSTRSSVPVALAKAPRSGYSGPNGTSTALLCLQMERGSTFQHSRSDHVTPGLTLSHASVTRTRYPNSIPAGTRIPHWAYLEVSAADTWDATAAQSAGDTPEGTATTVPSTPSTSVPSSSTSPSSSSNKSSSSTGAIAGGVVGGVVGATVLVGLIIWYTRRRRWRAVARPSPFMTDAPHVAAAFGIPDPGTSMPKYYDPSDPSTFPPSLMSPSVTVIQTTPGSEQAHGTSTPPLSDRSRYNGLPLV
ncbi:hypothetical protein EDB85DRAFT_2251750 [Lactarius pseudohatsudake]|nr:hypothetical protein EDB85DRAFT_2251750 [Lactarius pseudohatsudake]